MVRDDLTVLYYTSNREEESFERKIQERLLERIGDLPLISISHKPIKFGYNICVGDVGLSDYNIYRQMKMGCLKATTRYVCTAESDCLYPPTGYFDFIPPDPSAGYHLTNLHILYRGSGLFREKAYSLCALFINRYYLLSRFDRALKDNIKWRPVHKRMHPLFYRYRGWIPHENPLSVINIKTGKGIRTFTGVTVGVEPKPELPYWGKATDLEKQLWT